MMGLLGTKEYLTHDALIERIFQEYRECDKKKYTSLFLSSLSTNKLSYRSGLPVFAIMQSYPMHSFAVSKDSTALQPVFDEKHEKDKAFVISRTPCQYCSSVIDVS